MASAETVAVETVAVAMAADWAAIDPAECLGLPSASAKTTAGHKSSRSRSKWAARLHEWCFAANHLGTRNDTACTRRRRPNAAAACSAVHRCSHLD